MTDNIIFFFNLATLPFQWKHVKKLIDYIGYWERRTFKIILLPQLLFTISPPQGYQIITKCFMADYVCDGSKSNFNV